MTTSSRDRLAALLDPARTAVVTMEIQRGVVGPAGPFPALAAVVADHGMVERVAHLCRAARGAGARVVHATMRTRPDGAGQSANTKVSRIVDRVKEETGTWPTEDGTPNVDVMPEVLDAEYDIEVSRMHGMTPFLGTSLDRVLRNLGVQTVVCTGVSVNIGVLGMVINASDLGYDVIVPRDGVCGVPVGYADAVIDNTLSMLATITTVEDVVDILHTR